MLLLDAVRDNIDGMSSSCTITDDTQATGAFLRQLREQVGLSQRDLASRLGCQQPAIARLETGGVRPNLLTLQRIVEALGFELEIQAVDRQRALTTGVPAKAKRPGHSHEPDLRCDFQKAPA